MTINLSTTGITGAAGTTSTSLNSNSASLQTMNQLRSLNLSNKTLSISSILDDSSTFSANPFVKKYEIYDLAEDVVALSVAKNRNKTTSYYKFTDPELFKKVTQEDRDKADIIRAYYQKKFTYIGLTSNRQQQSGYRTDLLSLLNSDGKKVQENIFGVAFWLPIFYEYDIERDCIKQELLTKGCSEKYGKLKTETVTVQPLKRIHRKTKRTNFYEYWFKTPDNYGLMITSSVDNNLLGMIEYFFNRKQPITIEANMYTKVLDNFEYLCANKWTLVQA